jgi:putative chitinase
MLGWLYYNLYARFKKKPMPILITPEQLDQVTTTLNKERCKVLAELLNELCTKYGITEKLPFRMFLANILQESLEMNHKEENMNYSAKRLVQVWPNRFPNTAAAEPYAHNPVALSNKTYGGRMGNTQPNDGYTFKGAAFIGITGRELYTKYAKYINKTPEEAAELMKSEDRWALDASCWFFAVLKDLVALSKKGDFKAVCKAINGGLIGYDVRLKYYDKINANLS